MVKQVLIHFQRKERSRGGGKECISTALLVLLDMAVEGEKARRRVPCMACRTLG